jgi:hypothetical protein
LTQLSFYNIDDIDLTTFDIQQVCPNLVNFKFISSVPIPNHRIETVLEEINPQMKTPHNDMDTVLQI